MQEMFAYYQFICYAGFSKEEFVCPAMRVYIEIYNFLALVLLKILILFIWILDTFRKGADISF